MQSVCSCLQTPETCVICLSSAPGVFKLCDTTTPQNNKYIYVIPWTPNLSQSVKSAVLYNTAEPL
jgi:hypothetical protein